MSHASPPVPYFRAWVLYIATFVAVAIPVRLALLWAVSEVASDGAGAARLGSGAQMLAGVLLLPVSFWLFRWTVRGMLVEPRRGLRPGRGSG